MYPNSYTPNIISAKRRRWMQRQSSYPNSWRKRDRFGAQDDRSWIIGSTINL